MRFAHIASHTTNIGDGALIQGIQTILPLDLGKPIEFVNEDIWDFRFYKSRDFDTRYVQWLNDNVDLLLIGGGGMISQNGFSLPLKPDTFNLLSVPVVVYGVGHNLFRGEKLRRPEDLYNLIRVINKNGGLFSVRNDGSYSRLEKDLDKILTQDVFEIPDPGFYTPIVPVNSPVIRPEKINILLQLAGDGISNRFLSNSIKNNFLSKFSITKKDLTKSFLLSVAKALFRLSKDYPINIILTPHILKDYGVFSQFISIADQISTPRKFFTRGLMESVGVVRGSENASKFFDYYRQADLVIGMRGHSSIVAVGQRTPFVGLVSHEKISGFMDECNMGEWAIQIDDPQVEEKLYMKAKALIENPQPWYDLQLKAVQKFEMQRKTFHEKIGKLL